jgi:predicted nucleotidyltransferase
MYSYTNPDQIKKHYELFPDLVKEAPVAPIIKNNLLIPLDYFAGFFDARKSLRLCMEIYPKIRNGVTAVSKLLGVPLENMGLTGSLQYGRLETHDDDTDIIFYGTVEENYALMRTILKLVRDDPSRHVWEFGKFWPMRFRHGGILACPFFVYAREDEIPLKDCAVTVVKKRAAIAGTITDIRHSIYMPLVFPIEDAEVDGEPRERFILILSDSYVRGEFVVGQRVRAAGELVLVEKPSGSFEALIAANNWDVTTVES